MAHLQKDLEKTIETYGRAFYKMWAVFVAQTEGFYVEGNIDFGSDRYS
ncbi:MAG: hypothetical protein NTY64_11390 [Deltaproteobacteria bacterium]|nr:hypothetical protein [Deltaproteobacteria bacterium]